MTAIKLNLYSVSEHGNDRSGRTFDYTELNGLRRYLIHNHTYWGKFDLYLGYDILRDSKGEVVSFRRRLIGTLDTVNTTWKSKSSGKTRRVDPRTGKLVSKPKRK